MKYLTALLIIISNICAYYVPCEPELAHNTQMMIETNNEAYKNISDEIEEAKKKYAEYEVLQKSLSEQVLINLELRRKKTKILLEMNTNAKNINNIIAH